MIKRFSIFVALFLFIWILEMHFYANQPNPILVVAPPPEATTQPVDNRASGPASIGAAITFLAALGCFGRYIVQTYKQKQNEQGTSTVISNNE